MAASLLLLLLLLLLALRRGGRGRVALAAALRRGPALLRGAAQRLVQLRWQHQGKPPGGAEPAAGELSQGSVRRGWHGMHARGGSPGPV